VVEAKASQVGKCIAFFTVDVQSKNSGKLLAQGKHTKYLAAPKPGTMPAAAASDKKS
jgi:acyl-coenzyme A thioesterase 13